MNKENIPIINGHAAYFPALTGVRALAAFLVYVHHVRLPPGNLPATLEDLIIGCRAGVAIFFVLSGFLIAYRYAEVLQFKNIRFESYMLRRFARIYPLYFVLSVFTLIWLKNTSTWEWFLNLSLLKAFFEKEKFTAIFQGWSLTVEESFYLAAPLLFLGFRKSGLGTIILMAISGAFIVLMAQQANSGSFMVSNEFMAEYTIFGRCFEFFCGYKLAQLLKNKPDSARIGSLFTWLGSLGTVAGLWAIGSATDQQFLFGFPVPPALPINNLLFPLGVTVWFYGLITERTFLSKILSTRLFQVLGKSSYAFYLIHVGWFFDVIYFHVHQSRITVFFFLNICAIGIYYFFEEPVNQFIRKKFDAWELRKRIKLQPDFSKQKS